MRLGSWAAWAVGREARWVDMTTIGGFWGRHFFVKDTTSPEGTGACAPERAKLTREAAQQSRPVMSNGLERKGWWAMPKGRASRQAGPKERF
jgi:hypothetical protein